MVSVMCLMTFAVSHGIRTLNHFACLDSGGETG